MTLTSNNELVLHGDVISCLNSLKDNSLAAAITSPPYWKQRDYKFEDQIGQEDTAEHYIGHLVKVYNTLRKKLRKDGVFFLNIGDKYHNQYGKSHLMQIPYRLAYHMVKDGWNLQDIIIWYKPNHMPSSAPDRFANTFEPVIVLTKSKNNIYQKTTNVVKIPLQQTRWKHTAAFPEKLIESLLSNLKLENSDKILDPFAGTGTTAVAVKTHSERSNLHLNSIMIEKSNEFVKIIKERTDIKNIKKIKSENYTFQPANEIKIPNVTTISTINNSKYGEVIVTKDSKKFLSVLNQMTNENFKKFHRSDAIFFVGVKDWSIDDFYFAGQMFSENYVLRNILVAIDKETWYPIFMFVNDSTKIAYRFNLDRIREDIKYATSLEYKNMDFTSTSVTDISSKNSSDGTLVHIFEKYADGFPKTVQINWKKNDSQIINVINPKQELEIREGLIFKCRLCKKTLSEVFDPTEKNFCQSCGEEIWSEYENRPIIEEPPKTKRTFTKTRHKIMKSVAKPTNKKPKTKSSSKFSELDRVNWGASPGARSIMLEECFSLMRLYKIEHPIIAKYLKLILNHKELSLKKLENQFPNSYKHTIGHWFRTDFGGSIPIPSDISKLREVLGDDPIWNILEKTILKLQIVKTSLKGKNPGDFLNTKNKKEIFDYLKKLYEP